MRPSRVQGENRRTANAEKIYRYRNWLRRNGKLSVSNMYLRERMEEALRASEHRYRTLFEHSPISTWEEDLTEVRAYLDRLKEDGVNDFRKYLESHPGDVDKLAGMINVTDVNNTSVAFFGFRNKDEVIRDLRQYFKETSYEIFKEEMIALAEGQTSLYFEIPVHTPQGDDKILALYLYVIPGYEETLSRVLTSFIDVTKRKETESEREQLLDKLRQQTWESEAIISLSSSLRKAQTLNDALAILTKESIQATQSDAVALGLVKSKFLNFASTSNRWEAFIDEYHTIGKDLLGETVKNGHPRYLPNLSRDEFSGPENNLLRDLTAGLKACAFIPLKAGENTIGLLLVGYRQPQIFSIDRTNVLLTIAEIAGNTLHRMKTMEILERLVANRTGELTMLYNVVSVANQSIDLNDALKLVLDQVILAMGCKGGHISLFDEGPQKLNLIVENGFSPAFQEILSIKSLKETWEGEILAHCEPLLIPDMSKDPRTIKPREYADDIYSYLGVPIRFHGQGVGVLSIIRSGRAYTIDEMTLLTAIGDHVGLIVANARLYQRAEQAAVLEERSRLARELHDSATQTLYSASLHTETCRVLAEKGDLQQIKVNLGRLSQLYSQAMREMRMLIFELRPSILEQDGLLVALQQRLEMVESRVGMDIQLNVNHVIPLRMQIEDALYRIAIEALNNIQKHAAATSVKLGLVYKPRQVIMSIQDNGNGFDPDATRKSGGLGLTSMGERAEALGGTLEVLSTIQKGTTIIVKIPLRKIKSPKNSKTDTESIK